MQIFRGVSQDSEDQLRTWTLTDLFAPRTSFWPAILLLIPNDSIFLRFWEMKRSTMISSTRSYLLDRVGRFVGRVLQIARTEVQVLGVDVVSLHACTNATEQGHASESIIFQLRGKSKVVPNDKPS